MISTHLLSCRADVVCEDPGLDDTLSYLTHGSKQAFEVRKTFRYEVRGTSPYRIFEEGDLLDEVIFPEDVLFVVYSRIHHRTLERFVLAGWVVYHGALVGMEGRRVLLLGNSGAGKTTLSLRLLLAGHAVEGDELVLERGGDLLALPRAFHLKKGVERTVPELASVLDSLPRMGEGNIRALEPARLGLEWSVSKGPIDELVWIRPNHGRETRLESKPPFRAVRRALKGTPGWGETRARVVASATRLGSRGGHRLILGDAEAAIRLLEELVRNRA